MWHSRNANILYNSTGTFHCSLHKIPSLAIVHPIETITTLTTGCRSVCVHALFYPAVVSLESFYAKAKIWTVYLARLCLKYQLVYNHFLFIELLCKLL